MTVVVVVVMVGGRTLPQLDDDEDDDFAIVILPSGAVANTHCTSSFVAAARAMQNEDLVLQTEAFLGESL